MVAIETKDLCKTYVVTKKKAGIGGAISGLFKPDKKEVLAVRDINLTIEEGELVGFLGPNGAGKTTTLKMLSGILYPTSGEARVLGMVPFERKRSMQLQMSFVMGNKNQLWWDLPAVDSFKVQKELYGVPEGDYNKRLARLVDALDLGDKIQTQVRKMSLGERMKCELVAALLHEPRVLFLDEPTIGLDVVSQQRIREFLKDFHREQGCTIVLTSHYMQDVQKLCERVIVIDHGTKIFDDSLSALTTKFSESKILRLAFSEPVGKEDLEKFGKVIEHDEEATVLEIPRTDTANLVAAILGGFPVLDVAIQDVELEEIIRRLFTKEATPA